MCTSREQHIHVTWRIKGTVNSFHFSYAPNNVGTAHIPHGTVYTKRCRAASVDPFLSAIAGTSQLLRLSTTVVLNLLWANSPDLCLILCSPPRKRWHLVHLPKEVRKIEDIMAAEPLLVFQSRIGLLQKFEERVEQLTRQGIDSFLHFWWDAYYIAMNGSLLTFGKRDYFGKRYVFANEMSLQYV